MWPEDGVTSQPPQDGAPVHSQEQWLPNKHYWPAENDPEEQQKRVRYTDILANALMVQNVADLTKA